MTTEHVIGFLLGVLLVLAGEAVHNRRRCEHCGRPRASLSFCLRCEADLCDKCWPRRAHACPSLPDVGQTPVFRPEGL